MDDNKRRLNLQFDMTKAGERQCWGIIELQGRHKSDFVARAVNFYAENSPEFIPTTADAYKEDKMFQSVMKAVLDRLGVPDNTSDLPLEALSTENNKDAIPVNTGNEEKPQSTKKPIAKPNTSTADDTASRNEDWDSKEAENQVNAFLDAMDSFNV